MGAAARCERPLIWVIYAYMRGLRSMGWNCSQKTFCRRRSTTLSRTLSLLAVLALGCAAFYAAAQQNEPASESVAARISKKRGSFLTVLDFGAKGDGKADDSAAIQE